MEPSEQQPYAEYTIQVSAKGYIPVNVSGIQVLPGETSVQRVSLVSQKTKINPVDHIVIPANTLFGDFPSKIPESEIKPVEESGEIVLSRVVVPEYIIVHDGAPSDSTARDYYVTYKDYIKVGSLFQDQTLEMKIYLHFLNTLLQPEQEPKNHINPAFPAFSRTADRLISILKITDFSNLCIFLIYMVLIWLT